MICMHCGAEIDDSTAICPYCDMPSTGNPDFDGRKTDTAGENQRIPVVENDQKYSSSGVDGWSTAAVVTGFLSIMLSVIVLIALITSEMGFEGNVVQTIYMVLLFLAGLFGVAGIAKRPLLKGASILYIVGLAAVTYNAVMNSKSSAMILVQLFLMVPAIVAVIKSRRME